MPKVLLQSLMVAFVIAPGRNVPGIVTRDWGPQPDGHALNLQLVLDGGNDVSPGPHGATPEEAARGMAWRGSVQYDADKAVGTWHWQEGAYVPEDWTAPTPKPKAPAPAIVAPETEPQVPTVEAVRAAGYALPGQAEGIVAGQQALHDAWSAAQAAKAKQP